MCSCVLVYVVSVVLLVASLLASMRWLLCGGDSSKKEKNEICNFRKKPASKFSSITVFINSKIDPHRITNITDLINSKTIKSAHAFLQSFWCEW